MGYRAVGLVLGMLACDGGVESNVARPSDGPPAVFAVVLSDPDLDAYLAGTRAEIRYLQGALRTTREVGRAELDSVGARAAGMPVERFRDVTQGVEAALKQHTSLARGPQLDSLRIELMVLQVRVERMP